MTDRNDSSSFDFRALQARVGEWHRDMFGEALAPIRILIPQDDQRGSCLMDEVDELCAAEGMATDWGVTDAGHESLGNEAADVALCILAYCDRRDIDLAAALERKFQINLGRSRERVRR